MFSGRICLNIAPKWAKTTLQKIPYFHLISWCGNFMERHSFCIVSGDSPKTMQKLCLATKFPHQELGKITVSFAVLIQGIEIEY